MNKSFLLKTKAGYTIIETMISISVFLVVVTIGMDSLLNANLLHQKSQDMSSITDSMSFIMEDMSRNIRTGYNYRCLTGGDNLSNVTTALSGQNCWGIAFESATGDTSNANDQWVYVIDNSNNVLKSTQGPYLLANFIPLNPDEVNFDAASGFSVLGAEPPADTQQPIVTIRLVGKITYKTIITPFSLQTSVSQRLVDK
jgi:type II secretory pathway pseudopilin PulG